MTLENGYYKRTKGTWIVEEITNEKNRYAIDDDGYPVATVVGEANANLIASAPEMLKALKMVVDYHDRDEDNETDLHFENARDAIAKAEGSHTDEG
jgi:predicted metal-dependent hydrolase